MGPWLKGPWVGTGLMSADVTDAMKRCLIVPIRLILGVCPLNRGLFIIREREGVEDWGFFLSPNGRWNDPLEQFDPASSLSVLFCLHALPHGMLMGFQSLNPFSGKDVSLESDALMRCDVVRFFMPRCWEACSF